MMGHSHRAVAGAAWVSTATVMGLPYWQVAAGVVPAVAFSAGVTSPDVDNYPWWKRLDKWVPDEWLGNGGPLQHRGLLHFWGLPALVGFFLWTVGAPWYAWAAIVGWASHLLADLLVGQEGYGTEQGVPLLPWWGHVGVGVKCDSAVEKLLVAALVAGAGWYAVGGDVPDVQMPPMPVTADVLSWAR